MLDALRPYLPLEELAVRRKTNKQIQHTMHALASMFTGPSECSKSVEGGIESNL